MGCCQSTTAAVPKSDSQNSQPTPSPPPPPPPTPPPVVIDEETVVKEVLTETPIPKPPPNPTPIDNIPNNKHPPKIQQLKIEPAEVTTADKPDLKIKPAVETFSEVSEVSELCSFTESYSTTTALTEKRDDDDDGEVTQRVNRSPGAKVPRKRQYVGAGEHLRGRERGVVRSPARRSMPSPEKKGQLPSRSAAVRNAAAAAQRRNVGAANVVRRDPVEGSARRSRSPATTRGEVGQRRNVRHSSPSLNPTTNTTGGRRPVVGKVEKEDTVDKAEDGGGDGGGTVPEPRESLDNPLVSLECFIFL